VTKFEFLQRLNNSLMPLSIPERGEIIQDFEEHFAAGLDMGKTEQQICTELGAPEACAAQYLNGAVPPQQPSQGARPVYTAYTGPASLNPNNDPNNKKNQTIWKVLFFIFLFGAFVVYPTALGLMGATIAVIIAGILAVAVVPTGWMAVLMISLCVALFTAGLFLFLLMTWLLKTSYKRSGF